MRRPQGAPRPLSDEAALHHPAEGPPGSGALREGGGQRPQATETPRVANAADQAECHAAPSQGGRQRPRSHTGTRENFCRKTVKRAEEQKHKASAEACMFRLGPGEQRRILRGYGRRLHRTHPQPSPGGGPAPSSEKRAARGQISTTVLGARSIAVNRPRKQYTSSRKPSQLAAAQGTQWQPILSTACSPEHPAASLHTRIREC